MTNDKSRGFYRLLNGEPVFEPIERSIFDYGFVFLATVIFAAAAVVIGGIIIGYLLIHGSVGME